ncbi:hypothetical protein VA596_13390 [Amycolatopsis sp., V23-08]|uniref:Uncharacterized protein n=1 Tax=Amycolatopsis heterodermiae TaxID=3110235 RepID=A0ABU5R4A3_9PSEU|nr:hypothetical protein [Amycolatopsis sp., V23-08]MEA5360535.1 hypothetical protein [Amycolatopsis sp., V23-08]
MSLFRSSCPALAAVLAFGVAGCSTPSSGGTETSTTEVPPTTGTPSAEPTGPETPRTADDAGVAISIPQLPIGGGADDSSARDQCVTVSWLQPELLPDDGVEVTGIQVTPRGAFSVGGQCGDPKACAGFTFGAGADTCSVAVTARGTGGGARLTVQGKAVCAPGKESSCQDLRSRVSPGSIPLTQPDPTATETTATG